MKYEILNVRVEIGTTFDGNSRNSFNKAQKHYDYAYEVPTGVLIVKDGKAKILGTANILEIDVAMIDDTGTAKIKSHYKAVEEKI